MGFLSQKEVLCKKLSSINAPLLRDLAKIQGVSGQRAAELVKNLMSANISEEAVDSFIKDQYKKKVGQRQEKFSDNELLKELDKVNRFKWGVIQGQLDNKIQVGYIRKYYRYDNLIAEVEASLYDSIKDYVICSWYNHWSTVLIEDLISTHPNVIPTLKNIKGTDIFFKGQPFDLKITYMPKDFCIAGEVPEPTKLAIWLYENQGSQRFGAENRLFVVVYDKENPDDSWKIKRDIELIKKCIHTFFNNEILTENDEIVFNFQRHSYTALTKILLIVQ